VLDATEGAEGAGRLARGIGVSGMTGGGDLIIGTVVSVSTLIMVFVDCADVGRSIGESMDFGDTGEGEVTPDLETAESWGDAMTDLVTSETWGEAMTDLDTSDIWGDAMMDLDTSESWGEAMADLGIGGSWGDVKADLGISGSWGDVRADLGISGSWGDDMTDLGTREICGDAMADSDVIESRGEPRDSSAVSILEDPGDMASSPSVRIGLKGDTVGKSGIEGIAERNVPSMVECIDLRVSGDDGRGVAGERAASIVE
jgi:hypothetical protein